MCSEPTLQPLRRAELHGDTQGKNNLAWAPEADALRRKATFQLFVLSSFKRLSQHSVSQYKVCTIRKKLRGATLGTPGKLEHRLWSYHLPSCPGFLRDLLLSLELASFLLLVLYRRSTGHIRKLEPDHINLNTFSAVLLFDSHSKVQGENACMKLLGTRKNTVLLLLVQQGGSHAIPGQGSGG